MDANVDEGSGDEDAPEGYEDAMEDTEHSDEDIVDDDDPEIEVQDEGAVGQQDALEDEPTYREDGDAGGSSDEESD